jgi:hypothetical protein
MEKSKNDWDPGNIISSNFKKALELGQELKTVDYKVLNRPLKSFDPTAKKSSSRDSVF